MLDRRQFLGAMGASVLGLGLVGCGGSDGGSTDGGASSGKKKVAMVTDGQINDGGWDASCYKAMTDAADEAGWDTAYSESVAQSDWATTMENYIDQGYDMVFLPGNQYTDVVKQVGKDFPDAHLCILNSAVEQENVVSLVPNTDQIGQLAGALAGLITKTNSVGFIGAVELDTTKSKLENFEKAAKKVNPDVQVTSAYAGSFTDAAKGKELATTFVNSNNVDVMFGDASIVDTGAREALAIYGDRYDIGQPGDLGSADDKLIACSVVTDNKAMILSAMKDVEAGSFGNKIVKGDLDNGGVAVGTFSNIVDQDTQAKYQEIVSQIKAGTFL